MKIKKPVALLMGLNMLASPTLGLAAPIIPGFTRKVTIPLPASTTTLPQGGVIVSGTGTITPTPGANELVVNQNSPQMIVNWEKFNIGAAAAVRFNQKDQTGKAQKDWAALNRIYDKDPSLIFGKLSSDGKVFLINQNGVMFGAGSQVNVHSLVGSTLNMKDSDFTNRALRFSAENYQNAATGLNSSAVVANQGSITTTNGGSVFLLAPNVENSGSIVAPGGKINLIASAQNPDPDSTVADVQILEIAEKGSNDVIYRSNPTAGMARNLEGGIIQADQGRVGMFGHQVRQDGLIRAITAVKSNGEVYLFASDRVTTGAKSLTDVSVTDSPEKVDQSFSFSGGTVSMGGVSTTTNGVNSEEQTLSKIEHNGAILAPSGTVDMRATGRVYLSDTSSINVAGLWVDRPAADNQIEVQLNSVELKDSYGQKNGFLKGEKIKVDVLTGSNIGDISGSYLVQSLSASQRATKGGKIFIGAPDLFVPGTTTNYTLGDIILKPGAMLDFSGGGSKYAAGTIETSRLLSGNKLYDISSAPQWLTYSKLVTGRKHVGTRTVGSDAGKVSLEARAVLLDGTLRASVTPGKYQTVTTAYTDTDHRAYDVSVARGLEQPSGGTLLIGKKVESGGAGAAFEDFKTREIVVAANPAPVSAAIGPDDALNDTRTILSSTTLSALELGTLGLYANTRLTVEPDALLRLGTDGTSDHRARAGELDARARAMNIQGEIIVPAGTVNLLLQDNISSHAQLQDTSGTFKTNSQYDALTESFILDNGATISVAGERIDNSPVGNSGMNGESSGLTAGGTIRIKDNTVGGTKGVVTAVEGYDPGGHSLIVRSGALLDVSGGYSINTKGKVSGADAGTLEMSSATLSLAGELRGHSLEGKKGGRLKLHAGEVQIAASSLNIPDQVAPDATLPDTLRGKLVLGEHRLDNSGFGRIELSAINSISAAEGVSLNPSIAKLAAPVPGKPAPSDTILFAPLPQETVSPDFTGATSLALTAGVNIYKDNDFSNGISGAPFDSNSTAAIDLAAGSRLATVPGGSITLSAPTVQVEGTLEALSGSISMTASRADLNISSGATINARGYNKPTTSTIVGVPSGAAPQAGGSVTLTSSLGQVILEQSAVVDVSGTEPTTVMVKNAAGVPEATVVASTPGSLSISSGTGLQLNGQIRGKSAVQGQAGGSLSVKQTAGSGLSISAEDIRRYMVSGFDALTFGSPTALLFQSGMDMQIGRSLTLDAPLIKGNGSDNVTLSAPWVRLTNTGAFLPTSPATESGTALLSLKGEWLDLEGSTALAGFGTTQLQAGRDMRLSDRYYDTVNNGDPGWYGGLQTGGDLVLQGTRIYPTTAANFSIASGGRVTTQLPTPDSKDTTPIYSAGGNLSITAANGINHTGYLAAPMGQILLNSKNGRVYLDNESITTTAGNAQVNYGSFDGTYWTVKDPSSNIKGPRVEGAPVKSITLDGSEVIVREGATLDNSGGGSISTYLFQPGIEGSYNPISIDGSSSAGNTRKGPNRFVILQDNSVQLPGFTYTDAAGKTKLAGAVHLQTTRLDDGTVLQEGTYSLLPEAYAFLPGARIISNLGTPVASGVKLRTTEGYQVVAGYETYAGTSTTSPLTGYSIRTAASVLKEGNFTTPDPIITGDSGDLTIKGTSTILSGTMKRNALNGYNQGTLALSAKDIIIQEETVPLPIQFDFSTPLTDVPGDLTGKMQVAASSISGEGPLVIGDQSVTESIRVASGSTLESPQITLAANKTITLESNSSVNANGGKGIVTLSAHDGAITIAQSAGVHATNAINLDADRLDLQGEEDTQGKLDSGHDMSLTSKNIVIAADGDTSPGLHLSDKLIEGFKSLDNVTLTSTGDTNTGGALTFLKDVKLAVDPLAKGSLTIDAARIVNGGAAVVTMAGPTVAFKNSKGTASNAAFPVIEESKLTIDSSSAINIADNIAIDGFKQVDFNAENDLTLAGAGSLKTAGDLNLKAARITTTYIRDAADVYHAADISLEAAGTINITKSTGTAGSTTTPGGILSLTGSSITSSGNIVMPSGQVNLTATSGDISLGDKILGGAMINTQGIGQLAADKKTIDYSPGGWITLRSNKGGVKVNNSTELNVSADEMGDAGAIALIAHKGAVDLTGASLKGKSTSGQGGSFTIDTDSLDTVGGVNGLSALIDKIEKKDGIEKNVGGFTNRLNIHARNGNLELAAGKTIAAREVIIAADGADNSAANGNITLNGTIDASNAGGDGGRVELYANGNLTMQNNSKIDAHGTGTGAAGGEVRLSSVNSSDTGNSQLTLADGSKINVPGGGTGKGGSVYLRSTRNGDGVNMNLKGATVSGAAKVIAEAVQVHRNTTGTITAADQATYKNASDKYMTKAKAEANRSALLAGLKEVSSAILHFRPGVEVRVIGDLALGSDWDLTSWRYNGEPGVLTLRASDNLAFGDATTGFKLIDAPSIVADNPDTEIKEPVISLQNLSSKTMQNSWGYNLAAGADLGGANPLATLYGTGKLLVGPSVNGVLKMENSGKTIEGALIYTENAPLRFASGNTAEIGYGVAGKFMINDSIRYNIGTYAGDIRGETGGNMIIDGGAIQSALGDIDLRVGGKLSLDRQNDTSGALSSIGTIRTTGEYTPGVNVESSPGGLPRLSKVDDYWTYNGGGDITLTVAGALSGEVNNITTASNPGLSNAWDTTVGNITENKFLAASYGGTNATEGIATMAGGTIKIRSGGAFTSQTGAFGEGDLSIISGGDLSGRFRLTKGDGELRAMGNFGTESNAQVLEVAEARLTVSAQGDMHVGAVLNPDNTRVNVSLKNDWNLTYSHFDPLVAGSRNAAVAFNSLSGNMLYDGTSNFDGYTLQAMEARKRIVTPEFSILAHGDISIKNSLALAPSPTGNLKLVAGGTIDGSISDTRRAQLAMVDVVPSSIYGRFSKTAGDQLQAGLFAGGAQTNTLLHADDTVPVEISGYDITNLQLDLNKQARISAENDIRELWFQGQNVRDTDITSIQAGNDITYSFVLPQPEYLLGSSAPGLRIGGPGTLLVQADNNIDLGNSAGIQSFGNSLNSALGKKGSTLVVVAGATDPLTASDADNFFYGSDHTANNGNGNGLRWAGIDYTNLKTQGDTTAAEQRLEEARRDFVRKYFKEKSEDGSGSINMVSSQISTLTGPDEIFILSRSNLNVGKSTFSTDSSETKKTGITTTGGGPINIYAGGDVNVNESRVMTLLGGDITIWSDKGNINAGRGSKTTVAPPKTIIEYGTDAVTKARVVTGFRIEAPSIGSGLRAVTFDPNPTPAGDLPIPEEGNIYGFAPEGIIDAGEAGIAGGKITLAATEFANTDNISFSNSSVGVPSTSDAGVSLGALAGAGSVTENSKMMEQATAMGDAKDKSDATQVAAMDDFMSKFLDVRIIGFDTDEGMIDKKEKEKEKDS